MPTDTAPTPKPADARKKRKTRKKPKKADRRPRPATAKQQLLTFSQISQEYGPPYRSIYDWYVIGKLPVVRFTDGGRLWARRQDVEKLIANSLELRPETATAPRNPRDAA